MANETIHIAPTSDSMHIQFVTSGTVYSSQCGVGWWNDVGEYIRGGVRFSNIQIARSTTGIQADLHIRASVRGGSGTIYVKVYGIKEDNTGTGDPFGRTRTTANNSHSDSPSTNGYFTIGVGSIMEEIIARGGWNQGNAIGFIFEDNGTSSAGGNNYIFDDFSGTVVDDCYLSYRIGSEPNFKPTPTTISAPSLPAAGDVGMKFSKPGVSVFDATDEELYLTTRKKVPKIFSEALYTATAAETKSIYHGLGYVPIVNVRGLSVAPGSNWVRLPRPSDQSDHLWYIVDSNYLYLHSADTGDKFYYRIFLDGIT